MSNVPNSLPMNGHRQVFVAAAAALTWVIADCALAWSWVVIPGGPDVQRAWHAVVVAVLVIASWPVCWWFKRDLFLCAFCGVLCLLLARASLAPVDFANFTLEASQRPSQAWALGSVAVGAAFALALLSRRGMSSKIAFVALAFGAIYSWIGPLQVWLCGPSTAIPTLCAGPLSGQLRPFLVSIAVATISLLAVILVTRIRNRLI